MPNVRDATTRRFALSRPELLTTAAAGVISTGAYVVDGAPYLARGVVGDLLGFAILAAVAAGSGKRLRHEAAVCLVCIGGVVGARPAWPLRLGEPVWWGLFLVGLGAYVVLRKRVCN